MTGDDPTHFEMGDAERLEDLVDREALSEVCDSFFGLFGLPLRVFADDGSLVTDVHQQRAICGYVNTLDGGRAACSNTVLEVRQIRPEGTQTVLHPCFTGAVYRVVPIRYDGRALGRIVLGPYLPSEAQRVPRSLLNVDQGLDPERAVRDLNEMPRVKTETVDAIVAHLTSILDLILFSGHKAYLTSRTYLKSVRASFRELSEKTARLQATYDELRELDQLKSNFLATISHELRTPLTSIIGYSEMLATGVGGALSEEQTSFVETIRQKGDQLLELITSLLDMSRLEHDKIDLHLERLNAGALIEDVVATSNPQARRRGIQLTSRVAEGLPQVTSDTARLRQVLQNLTDNAIKFTGEGGTVSLEVQGGELPCIDNPHGAGAILMAPVNRALHFTVRDTGVGIAEDQLSRVFAPFYQVDGSVTREYGGTGLGLSIVKRLVEAHGGRIWVDSTLGQGTSFHFAIPEEHDLSP